MTPRARAVVTGWLLGAAALAHAGQGRAISTSQRFLVVGSDAAAAVAWAAQLEDVAARLAQLTGTSPSFQRGEFLTVILREDPARPGAGLEAAQYLDAGLVQQKLLVRNFVPDMTADVLAEVCRLLANRCLLPYQDLAAGNAVLAAPDWLAVGLAQSLYPEPRARNARLAWREWQHRDDLSVATLLSPAFARTPATLRNAAWGTLVGWLADQAVASWAPLYERLALGRPLTIAWLAATWLRLPDARYLEQKWDVDLAAQRQVRNTWGAPGSADIEELERLFVVSPELLSVAARRSFDAPITLEDLVAFRPEPWLPTVAAFVDLKARRLGLGQPEDFQRAVAAIREALDGLRTPPAGWWSRRPDDAEIRRRIAVARAMAKELAGRAPPKYPALRISFPVTRTIKSETP